jgi:hypothetical protein
MFQYPAIMKLNNEYHFITLKHTAMYTNLFLDECITVYCELPGLFKP